MVKGVLAVAKTMRTKTFYNGTRNEICLTANEILLRKVKSDKSDEISLCEVYDTQNYPKIFGKGRGENAFCKKGFHRHINKYKKEGKYERIT